MMDRIAVALTLPLLLGGVQVPENWKAVESKAGRFSAAMPSMPIEKTQTVATATAKLQVTLFIAEGRTDGSFVVSYTDYAEADLKIGTVEKRLDLARDGAVASAGGKLKSEKAIELSGNLGRELVIEKDAAIVARLRLYFVDRRLYQVMVLGNAPVKDVSVFFDSFRLNK
jgi:hypothetical protein